MIFSVCRVVFCSGCLLLALWFWEHVWVPGRWGRVYYLIFDVIVLTFVFQLEDSGVFFFHFAFRSPFGGDFHVWRVLILNEASGCWSHFTQFKVYWLWFCGGWALLRQCFPRRGYVGSSRRVPVSRFIWSDNLLFAGKCFLDRFQELANT